MPMKRNLGLTACQLPRLRPVSKVCLCRGRMNPGNEVLGVNHGCQPPRKKVLSPTKIPEPSWGLTGRMKVMRVMNDHYMPLEVPKTLEK